MSRAILIPFHRYHPHAGEFYKVYFQLLLKNLEYIHNEFDHLYLIDQEWGFSQDDVEKIKKFIPVDIIVSPVSGHHWSQFKYAIPFVKENHILFLDNDVVFYRSGAVSSWFEKSESGYDVVSAFDGSGGLQKQVFEKYPQMKSLGTRMGSYYFILTKELLSKIPHFNFEPITYSPGTYLPELDYRTVEGDWSDSFGYFTLRWLAQGAQAATIIDDRSSVYLIGESISQQPDTGLNLGYYHIRNGNLPVYQMTSKYCGWESDYTHSFEITPTQEAMRILSWYQVIMGESDHILGLVSDRGISHELWTQYVDAAKEYHHL